MAGNIGEELILVNWRSATKSPIKNLPILINSLLGVASGFTRACVKKQCFYTSSPPCGKSDEYLLTLQTVQIILLPSRPRNSEHAAEIFLGT